MAFNDNLKNITPNLSEIKTGTPILKIGNQYFVNGIGGNFIPAGTTINGGSGYSTKYYKCAEVIEATSGDGYVISGCGYASANGTYTPITLESDSEIKYKNENNCYLLFNSASGWSIILVESGEYYTKWEETGSVSESLLDVESWYDVGGEGGYPEIAAISGYPPSWSGYEASIDPITGVWSFSEVVTSGLSYDRITPVVGRVYDSNCTYRVSEFDSGIPIPSNGLVFYAPLANDRVDIIGTASMTYSNGTFTTVSNKPCISFNGDGWIEWAGGINIPSGESAMSIFGLVYLDVTNADWRYMFGMSDGSYGSMFGLNNYKTTLYARIVSNGGFDWSIGSIQGSRWYSFALTRDSSGVVKAYVDGVLFNSVNTGSRSVGKTKITLGASSVNNHEFPQYGKFADFAIYNRVITSSEILSMHEALMPS